MRFGEFDPVAAEGGSAAIENLSAAADSGKSTFVSREVAKSDLPLTDYPLPR